MNEKTRKQLEEIRQMLGERSVTDKPYWQQDPIYTGSLTINNTISATSTTVTYVNYNDAITSTNFIPMGWKEAESQDVSVRIEKAKKKRIANEKEIKRLTMGPKASRWR
jgi:hypothetical protein